eukprot:COSAG01_NODE_34775_length_542_cov_1.051919_1_plen_45_part_01
MYKWLYWVYKNVYMYTMHNVRALDTHFHVLLDAHAPVDFTCINWV